MEHGAWKNKKGKEISVELDAPQEHSQGNASLSSSNEDSLISRLKDML